MNVYTRQWTSQLSPNVDPLNIEKRHAARYTTKETPMHDANHADWQNHNRSKFGPRVSELTVFMSSQVLQVTPHFVGFFPLSQDVDSLVVKVSKLIHLQPEREILGHSHVES